MTVKWVKTDPLVMNGEPFCYGSRLTVRQLLELRRNGYDLTRLLTEHPELRAMGIASGFFEADGSLAGPGYSEIEAEMLPEHLRVAGIVVKSSELSA